MEITKLVFDSPENVVYGIAFLAPLIAGAGKLIGGKLLAGAAAKGAAGAAAKGVGGKLLGGKLLAGLKGIGGKILGGNMGAAKGLVGLAGGLIGGRKRANELKAAQAELDKRQQAYESFQFTNPYANMQNTYEDLTVNTQAADFAAQQQQQALASAMSGLQGVAGSSGIAALAQSLAQQQSANLQASSASIGAQESAIKLAQAQQAGRLQELEARGAERMQRLEFGRTGTLMGMAQEAATGFEGQKVQRKEQLLGGIGSLVGSGIFGKKSNAADGFQKFLDFKPKPIE